MLDWMTPMGWLTGSSMILSKRFDRGCAVDAMTQQSPLAGACRPRRGATTPAASHRFPDPRALAKRFDWFEYSPNKSHKSSAICITNW
jgi:hypothetical protein